MSTSLYLLLCLLLAGVLYLSHRRRSPPLPPGPTGLPIIGCIPFLRPALHRTFSSLAAIHGPLMHLRIGSIPTIIVSDSSTAELFVRSHDTAFANRPPFEIFHSLSYGCKGFAFADYGDHWRSIRKLCVTHLLCAPKIVASRSLRAEEVGLFVETLARAADSRSAVCVEVAVKELICDIVTRKIIGRKFKAGDEEGRRFKECIKELMSLLGAFDVAEFVPALRVFDVQGLRKRVRKVHVEFDEMLERVIDEHLKEGKKREGEVKDFVDVMLELMESGEEVDGVRFDRTIVKAVVLDMLEASMDTLRTPIEWALSELIKNPWIMKKAQRELETVVGLHRKVEEPDLPKLEYLSMIVKETLRLHPLSAFVFHHGKQEIMINGYRIPRGSNVMISLWSIGRDPAVWENAEEFTPERFVDNNVDYRDNALRMLPFGSGRRMCPGMQLALVVYPLILAQMIHCFDWELPEGKADLDMKEAYGFTLPRAEPLWAVPRKRLLNM